MTSLRLHNSRLVRVIFLCAGIVSLLLGLLGIFLPVLPTTPFVLLAAACFARSSKHFHDWLHANRIAGPLIREWHEHRSIPRRAKRWAFLLMGLSLGSSILLMEAAWHRALLAGVGVVFGVFLWRIPVRPEAPAGTNSQPKQ